MSATFQFYLDAAKALWEAPIARLQHLSTTGDSDAVRRAAADALLMKAEFMTPDGVDDQRKAVAILAAGLQDDPEFTLDVALQVSGSRTPGRAPTGPNTAHHERGALPTPRRRRTALVAVAAVVAALVALEVLATAGAAVPNPIGDVINELTEDEPEVVTPVGPHGDIPLERRYDIIHNNGSNFSLPARALNLAMSATATKPKNPKNPKRANGRSRNDRATKKAKTKRWRSGAKDNTRKQSSNSTLAPAKVHRAAATHAGKPAVRRSGSQSHSAKKHAPRKRR